MSPMHKKNCGPRTSPTQGASAESLSLRGLSWCVDKCIIEG